MSPVALGALIIGAILVPGLAAGLVLRRLDIRQDQRTGKALRALQPATPGRFDPAMLADLPEVAQRYFRRALAPGTPLAQGVALRMEGRFILNGTALPMRAEQVLIPPARGFVWRARFGEGAMRISGSDGMLCPDDGPVQSWTRFWLMGVLPVARVGGTADHARSAATRAMMEAVWAPATLLPQAGAVWQQTGPDGATVRFPALDGISPLELRLNPDGTLAEIRAMRWSDANAGHLYRLQPFGGRVLESATFNGFTIPAAVEMGNQWGTDAYAPFFIARITEARHPA
ncbi:MAG: hypothetical protein Kow0013_28220 [Pararhodobacter sp.]